MPGRLGKSSLWQFTHLTDFAGALHWLNALYRKGRMNEAVLEYFRRVTPLLRDGLDIYRRHVEALDKLADGVLGDPDRSRRLGLQPSEHRNLLAALQNVGQDLQVYFDKLLAMPEGEFLVHWMRVLESPDEYAYLLKRLIGDFGAFERLLPALPGTGPVVVQPQVQKHIDGMFRLNMRNLRLLELIRDAWRSWRQNPDQPAWSFFQPQTDLSMTVGRLIAEYLVQADPQRIRARREAAEQAGKPYSPYRFWRAAENLRLMADVEYLQDQGRKPFLRRPYIDVQVQPAPTICADETRLSWALKEIFNNSLSASSRMYADAAGRWCAEPLPRHAGANPTPAIHISLENIRERRGWRRRHLLRLTILDEGVGIAPEHLPNVALWAYSPRREEFRARAKRMELSDDQALREIQIGGKGIGLGYASAVVREHGGTLKIDSTPNEGTFVMVELPVPTPIRL